MHLKIRKYSKLPNLALASAAIASSMLIADIAQAETTTVTKDQNESSLIRDIGNDPMVKIPLDKTIPVTNKSSESSLIHEINQFKIERPSAKTAQNVS